MPAAPLRTVVRFTGAERYLGPRESLEDPVSCGQELLNQLSGLLAKARLQLLDDVITEDWGALLQVQSEGERFNIGGGFRGDDWVITISSPQGPSVPLKPGTGLQRLLTALHSALRELAGIADISWHDAGDWERGQEDQGAREPFAAVTSLPES
jgi:hypothetical protein